MQVLRSVRGSGHDKVTCMYLFLLLSSIVININVDRSTYCSNQFMDPSVQACAEGNVSSDMKTRVPYAVNRPKTIHPITST